MSSMVSVKAPGVEQSVNKLFTLHLVLLVVAIAVLIATFVRLLSLMTEAMETMEAIQQAAGLITKSASNTAISVQQVAGNAGKLIGNARTGGSAFAEKYAEQISSNVTGMRTDQAAYLAAQQQQPGGNAGNTSAIYTQSAKIAPLQI